MKILVCGTRKKKRGYERLVRDTLLEYYYLFPNGNIGIIEGCCPDSADEYAERWAEDYAFQVKHFPSTSGNYLKRNIEMLEVKPDLVLAFWDGFSYGTAHTIANAVKRGISVKIISI